MNILTRNRPATALEPGVIALIIHRSHGRFRDDAGDGDELTLFKLDGSIAGTSSQPESRGLMHRFVAVSTRRIPSEAELQEVTVDADGTVTQPDSLRQRDFFGHGVRVNEVVAEPTVRTQRAYTIDIMAAGRIRSKHSEFCDQDAREPGRGLGSSVPYTRFVDICLYSPKDGRYLGSAANPESAGHQQNCVRLPTDRLPSSEELQSVVVSEDGSVGDVPRG